MRPRVNSALVVFMLAFCATVNCPAEPPATQPVHPYFPLAAGTTWKYLVSAESNDKPDKPFVLTRTAGEPISVTGLSVIPIEGDLYQVRPEGVFLVGHREGPKAALLPDAREILPPKPRSGEAWSAKGDSSYTTCLGSQSIKTEAGEFTTQALFITSAEGGLQRQTYRYFARGVGLVRETMVEKGKRADGSTVNREVTLDLLAFTPAAEAAPPAARVQDPIGTDALRGELLDPVGQPIAQATLTLRRLDVPGAQTLQTDVTGRFSAAGLDPGGRYLLATQLTGYDAVEMPLKSDDRKPVLAALKLKSSAGAPEVGNAESAFAAGKKLASAGDHKGAIAKYDEAISLDPKNGAILAHKALSLLAMGRTAEAAKSADAALKLDDKDALIWEVVGQARVAQGQANQARASFDKAALISPKTAGGMYLDLAAALAAKNDNKLAGEIDSALKAAAAAEPPSGEALFQLGQSYANAGKPEGKTYLKRYLEVSGKLPEAEQDKQKIQVAKQLIKALDILQQAK